MNPVVRVVDRFRDLADVDFPSFADGDYARWNQAAGKFEGAAVGAGAVDSVFGRTGAVVAQAGDYSASQINNAAAVNVVNTFTQQQVLSAGARLANNVYLAGRNASNTSDVSLIGLNTSDQVSIAPGGQVVVVGGAMNVVTINNRDVNGLNLTNTSTSGLIVSSSNGPIDMRMNGSRRIYIHTSGRILLNSIVDNGVGLLQVSGVLTVADRAFLGAPNAAPNDAHLGNGQYSAYLDEAASKLKFRVRLSDGSYKTGEVPIA